jgi:hypothetical protein
MNVADPTLTLDMIADTPSPRLLSRPFVPGKSDSLGLRSAQRRLEQPV